MSDDNDTESDVVDSILENVSSDEVGRDINYMHDQKLVGRQARRSVCSQDKIDWDVVEQSDNLTAFGNNPYE